MEIEADRLLELPKIVDHRGNLTFIEGDRHVPFPIKRVYYLYDVPGGGARGGHAHREQVEVLIAINGSFEVLLDDGRQKRSHRLWRGNEGLYVPKGMWRELGGFTSGSVCLVLSSHLFDESDYIRNYEQFLMAVQRGEFEK